MKDQMSTVDEASGSVDSAEACGHSPEHPLAIDATVVGNVVHLTYSSHSEAFKQLYALRKALSDLKRLKAALRDPAYVHVALLRREIARPDIRDMLHVYGEAALARWDSASESEEPARQEPHASQETTRPDEQAGSANQE